MVLFLGVKMILEIIDDGAYITRDHESFLIKTKDKKLTIPAKKIDSINIIANAAVSTSMIRLCLENEINLVISKRNGYPEGRFWYPTLGKNSTIRRKQYLNVDTYFGVKVSNELVRLKIKGQYKIAYQIWKNRKNKRNNINRYLKVLKSTIKTLKENQLIKKDKLLGIEGAAASAYFNIFKVAIPKKLEFLHRDQIAKDPINVVLNYLYGICYREIESSIIITGLDPNSGFYHKDRYGEPTLTFDLIEVFRPLIDNLVLYMISKNIIKEKWFDRDYEIISLTNEARKTLIDQYYKKLHKQIKKNSIKLCYQIINDLYETK